MLLALRKREGLCCLNLARNRRSRDRVVGCDCPEASAAAVSEVSIIGYAIWLYYRFTLNSRDVQVLLLERGIQVSRETLREWCVKFASLLTEELSHREPRRGSRWLLDEVCVKVGGVIHWLWRAVDEHGTVLDLFLQVQRDPKAAKSFFTRLLEEYTVPEAIHTGQLRSSGAVIREPPVLHAVEHQEVTSAARCNNLVEQSHRPTRRQERSQLGFRQPKRVQEFPNLHARITNLHQHTRTTVSACTRRNSQKQAFQTWRQMMAGVA